MDIAVLIVRLLLALVFLVASITKVRDRRGTREAVAGFGVPGSLVNSVALLLPIGELVAAVLLVPGVTAWLGGVVAVLLLLAFTAGIVVNLMEGRTPDCHCFGQLHSEPIGAQTVVRNTVLLLAGLFVVGAARTNRDPAAFHQLSEVPAGFWVVGGGLAFVIALSCVQLWLLMRLWRRNEQVIIRLKMLEARGVGDAPATTSDAAEMSEAGLPPGSEAPDFALPNLAGESVSLGSLLAGSTPVFLVFTATNCATCDTLMPEVGRWQRDFEGRVNVVVVSSGSLELAEKKAEDFGLTRVLFQETQELEREYSVIATPGAVVIRQDGTIGSPAALGPDAVRLLLNQVLDLVDPMPAPITLSASVPKNGHGPESPPQSSGPRFNVPCPHLVLPDLDGVPVDLASFQGNRLVVLFANTSCYYSNHMMPDLQTWEANPQEGAPRLVVISGGAIEDIRNYGLASTVLHDPKLESAASFTINGTPIAALVDADGTYLTAAGGEKEVLAYLRDELPWPAPAEATA